MNCNWRVCFPPICNYGLLWAPIVQADLNEIRKTSDALTHTRAQKFRIHTLLHTLCHMRARMLQIVLLTHTTVEQK